MHPIEHLRYVARSRGADPVSLVRETASALSGLRHDSAGIVLAVRRIIQRHATVGPLWWLSSHVLAAPDPFVAMRLCEEEISNDPTQQTLCDLVPQDAKVCVVGWPTTTLNALAVRSDLSFFVIESNGDGDSAVERLQSMDIDATLAQFENISRIVSECDVVIVEAMATGSHGALCSAGSHAVAALGYCAQKPVWVVVPCGTCLPDELWEAMASGVMNDDQQLFDIVPKNLFSKVISKNGVSDESNSVFVAECPPTTELLRHSAM